MLFRTIFVALGVYAVYRWLQSDAASRGPGSISRAAGRIENPMFYREGDEPAIVDTGRPQPEARTP